MQHKPAISIVTPVLNGADYIERLILSVKAQSFQNWEHVIVDGGSTDRTIDIVNSMYADDARLTIIERPGAGIYASVMEGIRLSRGQIIGWQNADDLYTPWAFATVAAFQKRTSANWLTGLPGCWDASSQLRFVRPYGWYPRTLIRHGWFHAELLGFIQQESIFFTKDAFETLSELERTSVSEASLAGDFVLWKRLARTQQLVVLPTVISGFRRHQHNLSHSNYAQYMKEVRSDGAMILPPWLAAICRRIFRTFSSLATLERVEVEDQTLNRDFQLDLQTKSVRPDDVS